MMKIAHKSRRIYGLLSNWTPFRNPVVDKLAKLGLILLIGSVIIGSLTAPVCAWPSSWRTYTKDGDKLWDPDDQSPKQLDLRGGSTYAAGFYYQDSNGLYFRQRVDGDPTGTGGFTQHAWVVLIENDGDSTTYEWLLGLDGKDEQVEFWENTVKSNTPKDSAESEK